MLLNPYRFAVAYDGIDIKDYDAETPRLVFSTRRIHTDHTSALLRLRRSSDNAELDYGAGLAMGEYIDWSVVDTWVGGGGTAYVTTWYDQSGNDNHLVQTTAGKQPSISDASTTGASRTILFDGTDDSLNFELSSGVFGATNASLYIVLQAIDTGFSTLTSLSSSPTSGGGQAYFRQSRYGSNFRVAWGNTQPTATPTAANAVEHIATQYDGTNITSNLDNGVATLTSSEGGFIGIDTVNLGADATSHYWNGHIQEYIWIDTAQSSTIVNRIRAYQNLAYTIF